MGFVKAQVNQITNEPMYSEQVQNRKCNSNEKIHFGDHGLDIKTNDAKCIASRNRQQD